MTLTNANRSRASFTAPDVTVSTDHEFVLKVTDNDGATDRDTVVVTVVPDTTTTTCEVTPRANAGVDVAERELRRVTLDGSGSTNTSSYAWRQVGGPTVTLSGANTASPSFTTPLVSANTVLTFRLTATSSCGATATDDVRVTVRDNRAPVTVGTISARSVARGDSGTVSVPGYFSDPDGDVLTYTAVSSSTGVVGVGVSGGAGTDRGVARGSADVTVTARDRYGATVSQRFRVTVTVPPPTNRAPRITSAIAARTVVTGQSVAVRVSSHFSDPDNEALTYSASSSNETPSFSAGIAMAARAASESNGPTSG